MAVNAPGNSESVFTYGAPRLKVGAGASAEIGYDIAQLGAKRALLITDAGVAATGAPARIAEQMRAYGVECELFDDVHIEPTDASLRHAIAWARDGGPYDAYVAVGGGSSIDTAKAVNLLTTNPGELLDYVNRPVGAGRSPIEPLRPLIAVPTTTGTGSESTTVCVLDVIGLSVKTGISHEALRPTLAVVDPELTLTQPTGVTAASGMDILCHALESYTARPYTGFERHRAAERVPYCGANPIADMWCEKALALLAGSFRRSVRDGSDRQARGEMALAATFAGMGFGNAGVHIPHANGYPIAGQAKDFRAADYPQGEALVPHGVAVALTAPEAFRFTFAAAPERHLRAGRLLNPDAVMTSDPADFLPGIVAALMADIGLPNGLAAVGFGAGDIADLVAGTMRQQRLLAVAPVPVTEDDIARIFERSMRLWCAN